MAILKNQRWERFAQAIVAGCVYTKAYTLAGYKKDDSHAARLARNGPIKARVDELRQSMAGKLVVTMEQIALQLLEDRALAHEHGQAGAAASASMALAKLFGHITDRSESTVTHNYAAMTEDEVMFEIAAIHQNLRQIKAGKGRAN